MTGPIVENTGFSSLSLRPALLDNLASLSYDEMTPIQAQGLPLILLGKDVIAQAKTGSGKTATFALGLLQALNVKRFRVQSLVLCPTRELADQVAKEIRRLARTIHNIKVLTLCGGVAYGPQKGSLEHGAHIIIGTPGRVEEHLRKGNLQLNELSMLVLDEADRMLDMGFSDVLDAILRQVPAKRQTLLFSATFPHDIAQLAARVMNKPHRITIEEQHTASSIRQMVYRTPSKQARTKTLIEILLDHQPDSALVFCNTKQLTEEVTAAMIDKGFSATALHGDFPQKERDSKLLRFGNGSISVLVATDVAARGLDIEALDMVVNYHLPRDVEVYTHRIGRTGRAGSAGLACSLILDGEENRIELLEAVTQQEIEEIELPSSEENRRPNSPPMVTLQIDAGKKQKVRPGDLLGALTADGGIKGAQVGKINVLELTTYVAVERGTAKKALGVLQRGKVKGRSFRARRLSGF